MRTLERKIAAICRDVAVEIAQQQSQAEEKQNEKKNNNNHNVITIDKKLVERILGVHN